MGDPDDLAGVDDDPARRNRSADPSGSSASHRDERWREHRVRAAAAAHVSPSHSDAATTSSDSAGRRGGAARRSTGCAPARAARLRRRCAGGTRQHRPLRLPAGRRSIPSGRCPGSARCVTARTPAPTPRAAPPGTAARRGRWLTLGSARSAPTDCPRTGEPAVATRRHAPQSAELARRNGRWQTGEAQIERPKPPRFSPAVCRCPSGVRQNWILSVICPSNDEQRWMTTHNRGYLKAPWLLAYKRPTQQTWHPEQHATMGLGVRRSIP